MSKKIAVIGLGIMGHAIADNFLKKDYEVVVWNRTASKADDLVTRGAVLAQSPKDATEQAEIVFEVTANDESSRQIWLDPDGILAGAKSGQILVTCATLSVDWIDELTKECQAKQFDFLDMPMTGGRAGAEAGELILLVGGDKAKLETIEEDLKAIAKEVRYFGPAGSGTRYKLILNMVQAIHITGFGEAMRLAKQLGMDEKIVGEALAERPGGSSTNAAFRGYQVDPNPINFSVDWIAKDLEYAKRAAAGLNHPLLDEAIARYSVAIEQGLGQSDWTKINKI